MSLYEEKLQSLKSSEEFIESQKAALEQIKPIIDKLDPILESLKDFSISKTWSPYIIGPNKPCLYLDVDFLGISEEQLMQEFFNPIKDLFAYMEGESLIVPSVERSIFNTTINYELTIRGSDGNYRYQIKATVHDSPDCELVEVEKTIKNYELRCKEE